MNVVVKPSRLNGIVSRLVDAICAAPVPDIPYGRYPDWSPPEPAPEAGPVSREDVEVSVRATIKLLHVLAATVPLRGNRRQIEEDDLPALLKQITGLQKALRRVSRPALFMLLSGEDEVSTSKIPTVAAQQKVLRRTQQLTATLEYMRVRCDFLLEKRPGAHGRADYRKQHVAREAWRLLKRHRLEPASGIKDSLYGVVASLLWEATTGERDKDLQKACKAALRQAKDGELRIDGPIMGRGQFPLS